jgi:beta-lactamase regulating signal transducer with metallopeptidase domain
MTMSPLAGWMLDTMVATTLLCALVLAVRRPVARTFGPGLAYALWLLPALRMVLPPLPAFLPSLSSLWPVSPPAAGQGIDVTIMTNAPAPPAAVSVFEQWPQVLLIIWAGGAVLHLGWQYMAHRRLLSVLRDAETLDWKGRVRIVSSAAVSGPLSLGLLRPMIVLPDDNRMMLDAAERDLAVAHELAHHVRGDLWANGAAVLFASLHWFNPVVLYAWRAFRFDQESACDALVLTGANASRRGAYARALAKAASGRPSAFAASMMGSDKLKERLTMLIQPTRSKLRRRVGIGLAAVALVGSLGITASTALADPAETPTPPAPPAITADGALSVERSRDGAQEVTRIVDGDRTTIILRTDHAPDQAEIDRIVAQARASRADAAAMAGEHADGRQIHTVVIRQTSNGAHDTALPAPPEPPVPPAVPGEHHRVLIVRSGDAPATTISGNDTHRSTHSFVFRHSGEPTEASASVSCSGDDTGRTIMEYSDGAANDRAAVRIVGCGAVTNALRLSAMRAARQAFVGMGGNGNLTAERLAVALAALDAQIAELERVGN